MQTLTTATADDIAVAFREAVQDLQEVNLHVKGFRSMLDGNYFTFSGLVVDSSPEQVPVTDVCRLAGINPHVIQRVYFGYKLDELKANIDDEAVRERIFGEREQIITDLLPFPAIYWFRDVGDLSLGYTSEPVATMIRRVDAGHNVEEILSLCGDFLRRS